MKWQQPDKYYKNLPKKRMAAGALFFNEKEEILVLKPTYKDHWTIPGGIVDEDESPRQACVREIKEETSLDITDIKFLCVVYASEKGEKGESLQFVFYGGALSGEQIKNIKTPADEIAEYKFVKIGEAASLVSSGLGHRLQECMQAIKNNTAFYLEDWTKI